MYKNAGVKHDKGKSRYDLISPHAFEQLTQTLTYGAQKYSSRNWEKGIPWSRVFAAMMRHAWAFWGGQDLDPESGMRHIDHVQACAHFLSHYSQYNQNCDDRPRRNLEKWKAVLLKKLEKITKEEK